MYIHGRTRRDALRNHGATHGRMYTKYIPHTLTVTVFHCHHIISDHVVYDGEQRIRNKSPFRGKVLLPSFNFFFFIICLLLNSAMLPLYNALTPYEPQTGEMQINGLDLPPSQLTPSPQKIVRMQPPLYS